MSWRAVSARPCLVQVAVVQQCRVLVQRVLHQRVRLLAQRPGQLQALAQVGQAPRGEAHHLGEEYPQRVARRGVTRWGARWNGLTRGPVLA
jgi:hypothetical protein